MTSYKVWYGERTVDVEIPKVKEVCCLSSRLVEKPLDAAALQAKIVRAFESPIIQENICAASTIAIIIDDATRPTPSRVLLPAILDELERHATAKPAITIVVALGAHKPMGEAALRTLVGTETFDRYPVVNHQADDGESLEDLGVSEFGTPILVNRTVARANLRILVGMIKPHNQAGYTGGGKAILPGVCGLRTIAANHSLRYMSHPGSRIGVLEGNPIRGDIDDALSKVGPCILVNVVMDRNHEVADIVIGADVVATHKEGARFYDRLGRFNFDQPADVCLCGTPDPIDCNFYQMLNSLSAPNRLPQSAVKEGGTVVVFGRAHRGISDGDMREALARQTRETVRAEVFAENSRFSDRPALQIFLECEERYRIVVVTEEWNLEALAEMRIEAHAVSRSGSVVRDVFDKHGPDASCLVLPDAPYVILNSQSSQEGFYV